ncbi:MAG TPA: hypothetical protein ENK18_15245 [Deltaproteobacteria bacterium]|nr:hypothetical protein [Deltaproteobacteria bacterium]
MMSYLKSALAATLTVAALGLATPAAAAPLVGVTVTTPSVVVTPPSVVIRPARPGPHHVWVDGYWRQGPYGNRVWVSGHWQHRPPVVIQRTVVTRPVVTRRVIVR